MMEEPSLPRGVTPDDEQVASSPTPSKGIPIQNIRRTESELNLLESKEVAEYRDYTMYMRIITGMTNQRRNSSNLEQDSANSSSCTLNASWKSDDSLANIIRTRHTPIQQPLESLALASRFQHLDQEYRPTAPEPRRTALSFVERALEEQQQDLMHQDSRGADDDIFDMEM